jgi:hypothetical protein
MRSPRALQLSSAIFAVKSFYRKERQGFGEITEQRRMSSLFSAKVIDCLLGLRSFADIPRTGEPAGADIWKIAHRLRRVGTCKTTILDRTRSGA